MIQRTMKSFLVVLNSLFLNHIYIFLSFKEGTRTSHRLHDMPTVLPKDLYEDD